MNFKKNIKKIIPGFLLNLYHYFLAFFSAVVFFFPSHKLVVIGVTGTSGKSTTVDFITRIFEEAGRKVASISSLRFKIGGHEWKNELKMTMPGRFTIQKFLRQAVNAGCRWVVLEVTSEGIKQYRHKFINFDAAVFTNLNKEHIESHGGFENYRAEKLKLFSAGGGSSFGGKVKLNTHIINIDDENAKYFLEVPAQKTITFGVDYAYKINDRQLYKYSEHQENYSDTPQNDSILAENVNGMSFVINRTQFNLNVLGQFNIYNALAAIAVANAHGVSLEICKRALEKVSGIPGRMEIIQKNPFLVVVDYAHTPDQLEKAYRALSKWSENRKSEIGNRKLISVLGSCGGGRDKWKRPVLGEIASRYCREIIITNEDPYDEDPRQILSEIRSGVTSVHFPASNFYEILDRREAIKKAISLANQGDTVIITGKGSESLMCLENGKKIPWDDRQTVKESLPS